ncbi:MAG: biopolymer transporter ExbD [Chthoniobacteraceae bacterium]
MAGGGGGDGEPEFQVAPMIDVLLTILVFFMTITSAQVLKVDKTIKLPVAPDAQKKDNQRAEVVVNVRWVPETKTARFVMNDTVYNKFEDLLQPLKDAKVAGEKKITSDQNPKFRLVIRGDREVPALYISQAMNEGGEAGISDISFSAVNKD